MRILLLTQVVPYPPDSGPKIKTYNVLRYLAERHEVHLATFVRSGEEANVQELRSICASISTVPLARSRLRDVVCLAQSLAIGRPFLIQRDASRAMRDLIRRLLRQYVFDAVHADQLTMAQFAVDAPVPFRLLDEHNAVWTIVRRAGREQRGILRALAEIEWRKLRTYEGEICQRFDLVTVVSEQDKAALAEAAQAIFPVEIIPITVDTDELAFKPRTPEAQNVVSVATMFYPPNVEGVYWFATRVYPLIKRELAGVRFYIVGSRPPSRITRLADSGGRIVVTGYVADLEPILRRSGVMVVPVRSGSGMRVKILEAFARGIPVVSTTVGVEGIDARAGEHLLVADEPDEFARAVLLVLTDPAVGPRLAHAGRELAEARYDRRTALAALDRVYPFSREQIPVES